MKYLRKFNESVIHNEVLFIITDLLNYMNRNSIVGFDDIKFDNSDKMLIIKNIGNIWIRESCIMGYLPGNTHCFFILGKNGLEIQHQELFNRVMKYLKKSLQNLKEKKVENITNGKFIYPNIILNKPDHTIYSFGEENNLSPETLSRVRDIWQELNN